MQERMLAAQTHIWTTAVGAAVLKIFIYACEKKTIALSTGINAKMHSLHGEKDIFYQQQ